MQMHNFMYNIYNAATCGCPIVVCRVLVGRYNRPTKVYFTFTRCNDRIRLWIYILYILYDTVCHIQSEKTSANNGRDTSQNMVDYCVNGNNWGLHG
jgi:hypothetical protein